ncbi:MAG TPA: restriction endonuclease [Caldilineae bacterium]|nr:restriction endonuclease [Caldilineae bacterium]
MENLELTAHIEYGYYEYDPDTIDPEEQARIELGPYYEPPATRSFRRKRVARKRRRWRQARVIITMAWLLLYIPFFAAWGISGQRPLDLIIRHLSAGWLIGFALLHTLIVIVAWGWPWWREQRERRRRLAKLRAARTREQLLQLTPSEFEEWTGELFRRHGYQVTNTPDIADHGIDLIVRKDGEYGIVQCKRYRGTVGEPVVRDLFGVLIHERADRGYLVTTANISRQARLWARGKPIELIDGERLVQLAAD